MKIAERYMIFIYLFFVAFVLLLIGSVIRFFLDNAWMGIIELVVMGVLTAALVILYFKQTSILRSQKDLLTQELNQEARQQHTETLRERVSAWLGDPEQQTGTKFVGPHLNLPSVGPACIRSAPTGNSMEAFTDEEQSFQVIPHDLENDRYLQDLLQNHAPDLREQKNQISKLHDNFIELRDEFEEEYDGRVVEKYQYHLEPTDYLGRWIFDLIVQHKRGILLDHRDLIDRALLELDNGDTSIYTEGSRIWVQVATDGGDYRAIYGAIMDTDNPDILRENRNNAKEDVARTVKELLDEANAEYPFELAHEAAAILDEAAKSMDELEQILIEYDGRPIYPGDCKYLREANL